MAGDPSYVQKLENALIAADKAGNVEDARALAAELKSAMAVQTPAEPSVGSQIVTGAGKRLSEAKEGLQGFGLRVGNIVGAVPDTRLADYEAQVRDSRSVMSPNYQSNVPQTGWETAGGVGADVLSTMLGSTLLGKAAKATEGIKAVPTIFNAGKSLLTPTTVPQAAVSGAAYSLTSPSESGNEALSKAGVGTGMNAGLQFGGRQLGFFDQLPSNLTEQQKISMRRAVNEGFQFDPFQMSGNGMLVREGMKATPTGRGAFTRLEGKNQEQVNQIAKQAIGLPSDVALTNDALKQAYDSAVAKYETLKQVPAMRLSPAFKAQVDQALSELKQVVPSQRSASDKKAIRVLEEYKQLGTITGEQAYLNAKKIGENLNEAQKQGHDQAAEAFKKLRYAFEDGVEAHLLSPANQMRTNGAQIIKDFKEGRETLSNWFTVEKAFNEATGNVSAARLHNTMRIKPTYGTKGTPLETAAMSGKVVPDVLPSTGTTERRNASDLWTWLATSPVGALSYGLTSQPVRDIVARRQLGAMPPNEGMTAQLFRAFENMVPPVGRQALGDAVRYNTQRRLMGLLEPVHSVPMDEQSGN